MPLSHGHEILGLLDERTTTAWTDPLEDAHIESASHGQLSSCIRPRGHGTSVPLVCIMSESSRGKSGPNGEIYQPAGDPTMPSLATTTPSIRSPSHGRCNFGYYTNENYAVINHALSTCSANTGSHVVGNDRVRSRRCGVSRLVAFVHCCRKPWLLFTEMINAIGVEGVQVEELYSLDRESLDALEPIYGLIFLFKWRHGETDSRPTANHDGRVFFANQVINNACATQAILSILLNAQGIELGPTLREFKEFTKDFPPELKGLAISNSDQIRTAHNSFARPEPFLHDDQVAAKDDDDVFHFISYLPVSGTLYELDGLKQGPIALGECREGRGYPSWLDVVRPVIQGRIDKYADSEIRFNLMAVIKDRRSILRERLKSARDRQNRLLVRRAELEAEQQRKAAAVDAAAAAGAGGADESRARGGEGAEFGGGEGGEAPGGRAEAEVDGMQVDGGEGAGAPPAPVAGATAAATGAGGTLGLPDTLEGVNAALNGVLAEVAMINEAHEMEDHKFRRWKEENVRRQHNYIPFVYNFLRLLAENGSLGPLIKKALQKQEEQAAGMTFGQHH
eukprot:jgi/Mesvir1/15610/Mv03217-RA.1